MRQSEPASRTLSDVESGFPTFQQSKELLDYNNNRAGQGRDYSHMQMKADHERLPLWVALDKQILTNEGLKDGQKGAKGEEAYLIIMEAFNPLYKVATDFLIAIAEPISRASFIH